MNFLSAEQNIIGRHSAAAEAVDAGAAVVRGGAAKTVVFVHIPKTAGSTLCQIMQRLYKPHELLCLYETRIAQSVELFERLAAPAKRRLRMVLGHVGFGLHAYLGRPCTYATMLREPVDRIVSYYYFALRTPTHFLHEAAKELGLEGFARSEASHKLTNSTTKYLAEIDGHDATRHTLELAKANLERHFSAVGLVERFDESLMLLRRAAGWGALPYYDRANVTRDRPPMSDIPRSALTAIRARNELDLELYDWAASRFSREVEAAGLALRAEVATLRGTSLLYRTYRKARKRQPSSRSPRSSDLVSFSDPAHSS